MVIELYKMTSENNAINKVKSLKMRDPNTILKNDCSIFNPTFILGYSSGLQQVLNESNYLYVPDFNRYYFITNKEVITGKRFEVSGKVDVLESYKTDILNLEVVLDATQNTGANNYLNGEAWISNVKDSTFIVPFSNGLLTNGEYILITAGGIGGLS